jgi:hypothetical protein
MMDQRVVIVLVIVLVTIIVAPGVHFYFKNETKNRKQRIGDCLIAKGATDVVVTWRSDWDEPGSQHYIADFTDRTGQRCQITCKISNWSGELYWSEPPEA